MYMVRWLLGAFAGVAMVGLVAPGCGSDATMPATSSASSTGGGDCGFACSECGQCVQEACATEIDKCNGDPECATYATCVFACPVAADGNADPACVAACPTGASSEAKKAAAALLACRGEGAGADCQACGVQENAPPTNPYLNQQCGGSTETNPCFICEDMNCCETYEACKAEPDCAAFKQCLVECPVTGDSLDSMCVYQCGQQHPAGVAQAAPLWSCMYYHCAFEQDMCAESSRDACEHCIYEGSCGDLRAYLTSTVDGFLLDLCILTCPLDDAACDSQCLDTYPSANDAWFNYAQCILAACPC